MERMLFPYPHALSLILIARWLRHLRSAGLILVGVADNSVIPLPGSMDVLTIWLASSQRQYWFYYAIVATLSAVAGGYITYAIARKQGKDYMDRRLSKKRAKFVAEKFEHWGFWAVAIPAVLPPPFPIVPSLLAAGALQYPQKKFIGALILGRGVRFTILTYLGSIYGTAISRFFARYYEPALIVLITLSVISGTWGYIQFRRYSKDAKQPAGGTARAA
jgi:membrane protein YqaA with SNARE-associated domain